MGAGGVLVACVEEVGIFFFFLSEIRAADAVMDSKTSSVSSLEGIDEAISATSALESQDGWRRE